MRSTQTADSEFTKDSVYSRDARDDVSVAQSVATNNSEFTTDTARSNRSRRMKRVRWGGGDVERDGHA